MRTLSDTSTSHRWRSIEAIESSLSGILKRAGQAYASDLLRSYEDAVLHTAGDPSNDNPSVV